MADEDTTEQETESGARDQEPTGEPAQQAARKTARKTSGKTARKTSGKTARKTSKKTAEPSARKRATSSGESGAGRRQDGERSGDGAPRAAAGRKRSGASAIARAAAQQLLELTGREAEGVTGLERTEDGWKVRVEVVEVRRIPDTTDVLALYEVEVDGDGEMLGYHRVRRYTRGAPGEE